MPTKDEKLLDKESPQEQVDRMGNGWALKAQYDKQLELPVHMLSADPPTLQKRTGFPNLTPTFNTVCGLELGEVMLRSTDDPGDVTCKACAG